MKKFFAFFFLVLSLTSISFAKGTNDWNQDPSKRPMKVTIIDSRADSKLAKKVQKSVRRNAKLQAALATAEGSANFKSHSLRVGSSRAYYVADYERDGQLCSIDQMYTINNDQMVSAFEPYDTCR
jgi:hypothetical protein